MNITVLTQLLLAVSIGVLIPCNVALTEDIASELFRRCPITNFTWNKEMSLRHPSALACASTCAQSSSCRAYCHGGGSSLCHLADKSAPPASLVYSDGLKCYAKKCPVSKLYSVIGGRCIKLFTTTENFTQASQRCEQDGAHLYHLKTLEEDRPPLMQITQNNGVKSFWVGAEDVTKNRSFMWSDGTPLPNDSPLWHQGEPTFYSTGPECCVMFFKNVGALNDVVCSEKLVVVCQIDIEKQ